MVDGLAQELLDALGEPAAIAAPCGRLIGTNRRFDAAVGISRGNGASLLDRVEDPDSLKEFLRLASRSREKPLGTLRPRGGEGAQFRCEVSLVRPRRAGTGDSLLLVRLVPHESAVRRFVDLSQRLHDLNREMARRQRLEEELRRERGWLEVTLTSIGDAVLATDDTGHVVFLNPTAERLTGWRQEEAVGRSVREVFRIVNEHSRATAANPIERVLGEGVVVGLANHTLLIRRDGSEISIADSAAPIRDAQERLRGVVLVFHDVTEQRSMARELEARAEALAEAGRRKDEFPRDARARAAQPPGADAERPGAGA